MAEYLEGSFARSDSIPSATDVLAIRTVAYEGSKTFHRMTGSYWLQFCIDGINIVIIVNVDVLRFTFY